MVISPSPDCKIKCVLVSSRHWNKAMISRLRNRTKCDFIFISDPKDMTAINLSSINPRFVFFPHWSYRIDRDIHEKFECVIFHMTDLPFGRGGSPLQNLIARGTYETKISALRCVEEMDAGPIYLKRAFSLYGSAEEIYLRASIVIEDMIVEILKTQPVPMPQQGTPLFFQRRKAEEGNLTSVQSLEQAFDLIRMLDADGYPNAYLNVGPFKFEFARASLKAGHVMADVRITYSNNLLAKENDD
jgi:methionyl-tRNA formyltransferase